MSKDERDRLVQLTSEIVAWKIDQSCKICEARLARIFYYLLNWVVYSSPNIYSDIFLTLK